jgi:hypothetical protein
VSDRRDRRSCRIINQRGEGVEGWRGSRDISPRLESGPVYIKDYLPQHPPLFTAFIIITPTWIKYIRAFIPLNL